MEEQEEDQLVCTVHFLFITLSILYVTNIFFQADIIKCGEDFKQEEFYIISAPQLVPIMDRWVVKYHGVVLKKEIEKWSNAICDTTKWGSSVRLMKKNNEIISLDGDLMELVVVMMMTMKKSFGWMALCKTLLQLQFSLLLLNCFGICWNLLKFMATLDTTLILDDQISTFAMPDYSTVVAILVG